MPQATSRKAKNTNVLAQISGLQAEALIRMMNDTGKIERRKGGFWTTPNCASSDITLTWSIPDWSVPPSTVDALKERSLIEPVDALMTPPVYQLSALGRTFAPLIEEAISHLIPPHVPEGGYVELSESGPETFTAQLIQRIRRQFERRRRA
jgi:hypothetical protein